MDRRLFFGQVLGTITGLTFGKKWIAEEYITKPINSKLERLEQWCRMFRSNPSHLKKYRYTLVLEDDVKIISGPVSDVKIDIESLTINFDFYKIKIEEPILVRSIVMCNEFGFEISESRNWNMNYIKDDSLTLNYTLKAAI